jgi:hypothetical protein
MKFRLIHGSLEDALAAMELRAILGAVFRMVELSLLIAILIKVG